MKWDRKRCTYPMSQFYIYEDEVPKDERLSTPEDCEKCEVIGCNDGVHCLVSETKIQRKCFNHCPKCNATDPDIEWGDKDWANTQAWQNATCKKCGTEFTENYEYSCSVVDEK